jgi:hypothetical protein
MPGCSTLAVAVAVVAVVAVAVAAEIEIESQNSKRSNGRVVGPRRWVPDPGLVPKPELELEVAPKTRKRA